MLQEYMKNKEFRIHPNQMPIALYEWILNKFVKKGISYLIHMSDPLQAL